MGKGSTLFFSPSCWKWFCDAAKGFRKKVLDHFCGVVLRLVEEYVKTGMLRDIKKLASCCKVMQLRETETNFVFAERTAKIRHSTCLRQPEIALTGVVPVGGFATKQA
jgi:hypothetical protein